MYLSELQNKDIISVNTGVNLGRIVDAEVNSEGRVISLVAENKKLFRKMLKNTEFSFTFSSSTITSMLIFSLKCCIYYKDKTYY